MRSSGRTRSPPSAWSLTFCSAGRGWRDPMLRADTAAAAEWAARRERIDLAGLQDMAADVRQAVVRMVDRAGLGHIGGDLSVTDILVTLFGAVLDIDPLDPARPDRDRFILSKGHCAGALYATLAHSGFFPREELA